MIVIGGCSGELVAGGGGAGVDGAVSTATAFRPGVQQDLDNAGCIAASCHGGTVAPMPLVSGPATDDDWVGNYNQVRARAGTATSSLLIQKASGAGSHVESIGPADPMMDRWRSWIAAGAPYLPAGSSVDAGAVDEADAAASGGVDASAAITWDGDVRPLLDARDCLDCHGTAGAYSLETYNGALGFGTDAIPNVIPGDPTSLLLIYCEQGHYGMPAVDTLIVISWIVDWGAGER